MESTDDTNAARRGSELSEGLGPDGTLHVDGYFTWKRRDGYVLDAKLPAEFVLADKAREEIDRLQAVLTNYRASHDALRDWAQECRDQVLYLLAQKDDDLGRTADGLGQASVSLLGHNA